jgi:SAM-dependent methyltransferase
MWDDAWAYDVATRPFSDDVRFWEGVLDALRPRRMLDLGCGTGRLTIPLAAKGRSLDPAFEIVGLDASQPFLDAAARHLATSPELEGAVTFVKGDMSAFSFAEPFDLILLGYNNLSLLNVQAQRVSCFRAVRDQLAEGGHAALDLHLPDLAGLLAAGREVFPQVRKELEWERPADRVERFLSFFTTDGYDHASQTEQTSHYWQFFATDGTQRTIVKNLTWHH